jgi:chromosome segregation ATPase
MRPRPERKNFAVIIRRMQVEGGFLEALDLRFEKGLNVLIGGRGTGKSSINELIRYCLNIRGYSDEEDSNKSLEQALSVLQDGQVTLAIEDRGNDIAVTRSATSDPEGLDSSIVRPLIFSQKDVESVGLSVRGRLNIIDFFSPDSSVQKADERKRINQIQSLTTEISSLLREADQISDRLAGAESVRAELVRAEARLAEISKTSQQLDKKQKQLSALSSQSSALAVKAEVLRRTLETTMEDRDSFAKLEMFGFSIDEWRPGADKVDLLQNIRTKLRQAEKHVEETYNLLDEAVTEIETAIKNVEREKTPLEEQARTIRRDVEGRKEGAGAAARQLAGLREQVTQLDALKTVQTQKLVGPTAKARVNSYGGYQASDFIH